MQRQQYSYETVRPDGMGGIEVDDFNEVVTPYGVYETEVDRHIGGLANGSTEYDREMIRPDGLGGYEVDDIQDTVTPYGRYERESDVHVGGLAAGYGFTSTSGYGAPYGGVLY